jgi:hypothetical protein
MSQLQAQAPHTQANGETDSHPLLTELLDLLRELTEENDDFRSQQDDAQLWYNQGYARGMARALRELGAHQQVAEIFGNRDDTASGGTATLLPWEKALAHGYRMGYQETHDIWQQFPASVTAHADASHS